VTSDPDFKVTTFLEVEYQKKDKVTIAQDEKYLTYGMVLFLVTLINLQTRPAGLSASAEILEFSTRTPHFRGIRQRNYAFLRTTMRNAKHFYPGSMRSVTH